MKIALVYFNNDKYASRGAGYVASSLIDAGYPVAYFDTAYISFVDLIAALEDGKYDTVMMSASSLYYPQAKRLADTLKQRMDVIILLGGITLLLFAEMRYVTVLG